VARLNPDNLAHAEELIALYPQRRSALIPILHLLQEQDGYLSEDGMAHVAELVGLEPVEVRGTASFYDMFHFEPVGRYLVAVCTNIACMLRGAYELLEHVEQRLGTGVGGTSSDGLFTVEDAECLADCGRAPCLQVNHRFFGDVTAERFDALVDDLTAGRLDDVVPHHGTLARVWRQGGLRVDPEQVAAERRAMAERAAAKAKADKAQAEADKAESGTGADDAASAEADKAESGAGADDAASSEPGKSDGDAEAGDGRPADGGS